MNRIVRLLSSSKILTVLFIAVAMLFLFPQGAHAQETSITQDIGETINVGIKLLSWIWIIPASIAGKLMTNDFTYGSVFHLDTYLWRIRTIMRTFAYFTLGFIFIVSLIKHFVKNDAPSKLGQLAGRVALAGILIPATWFIIAAVIDISIVATAAVASFPHQIIEEQWNSLNTTVTTQKRINIEGWSADQIENIDESNEVPLKLEDILPSADNVAGPLVFLGAAILKLTNTNGFNDDQGTSSAGSWRQITIASLIKIFALLLFTVPIVVLMVVNMIRVFWIWIWIIFSPFIVLDQIFKGPLQEHKTLGPKFKIGNILGLIFQPVAIVGLIGLGMILIIGVWDILSGGSQFEEATIQDTLHLCSDENSSTLGCNSGIAEIIVIGGFFQDLGARLGGVAGNMILLLFTVFLLRSLVKAGFTMSAITKGVAESVYKFTEGMAKAIPIPSTNISWGSAGKLAQTVKDDKMGFDKKTRAQAYKIDQKVNQFFGVDTSSDIGQTQYEKAVEATKSGSNPKENAKRFWAEMVGISKTQAVPYNSRTRELIMEWFKYGNAVTYLQSNNIITPEEAKKTPEEIMQTPHFLTFVDHVMTNGDIPDVRTPRGGVTSLEGKKRKRS